MSDHSSPTYFANVAADTERLLRDGDAEVSALTGGAADQTVSARVAQDARHGRTWARWFCGGLSLLVQPGHCAAMRSGAPTPWWVYPRAAVCFAVIVVALHPTWRWIEWWGRAMLLNTSVGVLMLVKEKRRP